MLHCRAWSPHWLGFLLLVIKCAVFPLTLPALGIYGPRLIGPSELKITPICTQPENVLSISSCWRHQWAKRIPLFPSFAPRPVYPPPFPSANHPSLSSAPTDSSSISSSLPFLLPHSFFFLCLLLSAAF